MSIKILQKCLKKKYEPKMHAVTHVIEVCSLRGGMLCYVRVCVMWRYVIWVCGTSFHVECVIWEVLCVLYEAACWCFLLWLFVCQLS